MLEDLKRKIGSLLKVNNENMYILSSIKITAIYFSIGFLWIYFSEQLLLLISSDVEMQTRLGVYKGWFYVIFTSMILFMLIRDKLKKVQLTQNALNESYKQISSANQELQEYIQQLAASEEELRIQNEQLVENEKLLRRSESDNQAIIKAIPDLIFILNREGIFLDCKVSDESNLLLPVHAFIGKSISEVLPKDIADTAIEKIHNVFNTGNLENMEYTLEIAGKPQHFELRMVKSSINEILAISRDVTIEKEREFELIASNDKYKALVNQMQQGLVLYEAVFDNEDVKFIFIDANESYEKYLEMTKGEAFGKNILEIIPDLPQGYIEKFKQVVITGEPIYYERYVETNGKYIEVVAYRPGENKLALLVEDITQRKLAEEAVAASEYTFRNLFEGSSDGILLLSGQNVLDCNAAMLKVLQVDSKQEVVGKSPLEFCPEIQPDGISSMEKLIDVRNEAKKNKQYRFEWWYLNKAKELIPFEIMLTSIMIRGKDVYHCLCRDMRDRKQMEMKLEYLSYHDQLTGLYNRRFFEEELKRLDVPRNYPLTIVMSDVNGLKLVNDSFGHAVGDKLLKKVSEIFIKGCRADDIIARQGGDEFVILLPKTDEFEAEKIIKRIKDIALTEKVDSIDISVSIGYETKLTEADDVDEVMKKAEDHMYKKKLFESPSMRGKTINTIISTLYEKNKREELHSKRVSELSKTIGEEMGLNDEQVQELKNLGLLHDIGKIAVDENILNKPSPLDELEFEEIKRHPEVGYRILSTVNNMSEMADYVLSHHERWDGKGYPKGLKGEEIPLQSRIISVANAYDAMTSRRTYGKMLSHEEAVLELEKNKGTQFDPEIVKIFIEKELC
ncbi:MAG: HD domain-containing phosphohydrolase [Solirubrobacterales bacterium]